MTDCNLARLGACGIQDDVGKLTAWAVEYMMSYKTLVSRSRHGG